MQSHVSRVLYLLRKFLNGYPIFCISENMLNQLFMRIFSWLFLTNLAFYNAHSVSLAQGTVRKTPGLKPPGPPLPNRGVLLFV